MDKVKAKADLPVSINLENGNPIMLVISDTKISETLKKGLQALNVNVVYMKDHMNEYEKLLWAADMMLLLCEEPGKYLHDAWQNEVVPIATTHADKVKNYNPNKEKGNCFAFDDDNPWTVFAAIVRALETHKFPYDWKHIVKQSQKDLL